MNPQQDVFDNLLLRHKILTHLFYIKYKDQLYDDIKTIVYTSILQKWPHYCRCNECITFLIQHYNIMD